MKTGIILVGHGSKEPYNKETLEFFASKIKNHYDFVSAAFMQLNEPAIPKAVQNALDAGMEKIVVVPFFLARGVHIDQDIPGELGLAVGAKKKTLKGKNGEVFLVYTDPIGKDLRLIDILTDTISSAEKL